MNQSPESSEKPSPKSLSEPTLDKVHASVLRERKEPQSGSAPIPIWIFILGLVLLLAAALYMGRSGIGFENNVYDPMLSKIAAKAGPAAGPDPMVLGKKVFAQNCMVCHQETGEGLPGVFPPLVDSEWVLAKPPHGDNHVVAVVLFGLQGPVSVKGTSYMGVMPPWHQLSNEEIASVITYIRNDWGNKGEPITPKDVQQIRDEYKDRTDAFTQEELEKIPRQIFGNNAG